MKYTFFIFFLAGCLRVYTQDIVAELDKIGNSFFSDNIISFSIQVEHIPDVNDKTVPAETGSMNVIVGNEFQYLDLPDVQIIYEDGLLLQVSELDSTMVLQSGVLPTSFNEGMIQGLEIAKKLSHLGTIHSYSANWNLLSITTTGKGVAIMK